MVNIYKKKVLHVPSISFTFLILCHRKSAGALHHGSESIGHIGAGLPDDAAAALAEGFSEARHTKASHLSEPTFSVPAHSTGRAADTQTKAVPASLTPSISHLKTSLFTHTLHPFILLCTFA